MEQPIEHYLVSEKTQIYEAVEQLEKTKLKIVLIVDQDGVLKGSLTDGDIRRALMKKISFEKPVEDIASLNPISLPKTATKSEILETLDKKGVRHMILVDEANKPIDIKSHQNLLQSGQKENWVVLMAGGLGTRLRPLTDDTPKPMLKLGGSPILEILINNFKKQGFYKFYICVNYLGDVIKDYFGDGTQHGVKIRYIEENEPLDTAGALSLITETLRFPFFVVNGDIITSLDFNDMLDFHLDHDAHATMAIREYTFQVPYGVVEVDDYQICEFKEKPEQKYYVNAGIYLLNPETLRHLKQSEACTMPALFDRIKESGQNNFAFPVREHWLDIGRMEDFSKAEDYVESQS